MAFASILLRILSKLDGERSVQAAYHMLRGKRSGQTLQDIDYYEMKPYYCLLPKLTEVQFHEAVERLQAEQLITQLDGLVSLTSAGQARVANEREWEFNGWVYRGKEREFFKRLALTVQTLSHFNHDVIVFHPIQREWAVQQFVKAFFRDYPVKEKKTASALKSELLLALEKSGLTDLQKEIVANRLSGYQLTASTWDQLSDRMNTPSLTIQFIFLESLHKLLNYIYAQPQLIYLNRLAAGCRTESFLTDSASKTKELFVQGMTIDQISAVRHLKRSTVEDHLIEIASHSDQFPYLDFLEQEDIDRVLHAQAALQTSRLRRLKEEFAELTYFQIRLVLTMGKRG